MSVTYCNGYFKIPHLISERQSEGFVPWSVVTCNCRQNERYKK